MEPNEMRKIFNDTYGDGEVRIFTAPGRVNLIGEHIDYCGGCVMPVALTMKTALMARKRNDDIIRLKATDLDIMVETRISEMHKLKGKLKWGDYQIGVMLELLKDGYDICGADLLYDDMVPHGSGLSSSAAIELSTALCFATFSNEKNGIKDNVDMIKMALIAQRAEHNFIGVKCGIMDQFASGMGKKEHAVFLNCATLSYEHISLKLADFSIVITNTNVKHSLGSSKYNERRAECEAGLVALQTVLPKIKELADVTVSQFEEYKNAIEDEIIRKRIKHVVYECDRVRRSALALKEGNLALLGKLMNESHDSLSSDYEVSCPELDFVVKEGRKAGGVLGIRMTGAGFGGCTVAIIKNDCVDEYIEKVGAAYEQAFGHKASFYVSGAGDGAEEIVV